MTPKEKAEKLVDSFLTASFGVMEEYIPVPYAFAKQCALIAVDEIINEWNNEGGRIAKKNYWQEVKQEIENL